MPTAVISEEEIDLDKLVDQIDKLVSRLSDKNHAQIDVVAETRRIRALLEAEQAQRA
jgi:uncharacterized coiled-coil protein SlyX